MWKAISEIELLMVISLPRLCRPALCPPVATPYGSQSHLQHAGWETMYTSGASDSSGRQMYRYTTCIGI